MRGPVLWGILLGATLASGCTTPGNTGTASVDGFSSVSNLDLPETVPLTPSVPDNRAVAAVEVPDAASYAGPTPSANPLAVTNNTVVAKSSSGSGRENVDTLIVRYATLHGVPVELVRRVVKRESNFIPSAYNNGHWGLMQIKHATARGMGYQGTAQGLLDAETNLKYAVKYLRGAYLVADGNHDLAVRYYARGYYYDAKRKGLLDETGLGKDRKRRRS